jgi:hypothetical protein
MFRHTRHLTVFKLTIFIRRKRNITFDTKNKYLIIKFKFKDLFSLKLIIIIIIKLRVRKEF